MDKIIIENEKCILCGDDVEIDDYDEYLCANCYKDLEETDPRGKEKCQN